MENEYPGISRSPGMPSPLVRTRTGRFLQLFRRWVVRPSRSVWFAVSAFSGLAWRGFAFGSGAVILLFAAYLACFMRTGLWRWLDVVLGVLVTAIVLALTGLLLLLLRLLLKAWPAWFIVTVPGPLIFLVLLFGGATEHPAFPFLFFGTIILLAGSLGGSISVFRRAKTSGASRGHRIAATIWLAATVAAIGALTYWLAGGGSDPYVELQEPVPAQSVTPLSAPDPGVAGPFEVKTLFYGSGSDRRRPEFGQGVAIKTDPVDARPLLKDFKGFKAKIRRWYWGFGADRFPINGRVWYPAGPGRFPLVLVVHGNHQMEEYSDPGYAYLGELLASRGFICVSVDENFLNWSWAGGIGKENGVRGWILLQHLAAWRKWNSTTGNPFLGKVDLTDVALIGHSRGGEAVALAAAFNKLKCFPDDATVRFDFGFGIRSVVAIAPIDGQYEAADQPTPVENVNYLVLQGSHDSDVSFFAGYRPYRRVRFTDGQYHFKAALYTYRANHGQFNTVWGQYDGGPPFDRLINTRPLLSGEEQRRVARVFISGFLEATLHDRTEYVPMFRDHRAASGWLPKTIYLSQFEDSNYRVVSDFDSGIDVMRTTVPGGTQSGQNLSIWRERNLKLRGDWDTKNKAVYLGWDTTGVEPAVRNQVPSFLISLPDDLAGEWNLGRESRLTFSIADTDDDPKRWTPEEEGEEKGKQKAAEKKDENSKKDKDIEKKEPVDFTLELTTSDGATARLPLNRFAPVQPVVRVRLVKWSYMENAFYEKSWEPVFQTWQVPLAAFTVKAAGWDPAKLKQIRLCFDRTAKRVIVLDQVGFELR